MADSPEDLYAYEPPVSLWSLVESHVQAHEREEIKNVLGASLVEQSLELHNEINLLLDIWRDYREETLEEEHKHQPPRLPEPPQARERLKQEICFFVQNIREKAQRDGRDPDHFLNDHNAQVIDYALDRPGSAGHSRPSTSLSTRDGRETPMTRRSTPSSERFSQASTLSEEVESMRDKLNYLKLEEVVQHLRDTMEEEVEQLVSDVVFLQSCLDNEANYRTQSSMGHASEPTLTDLREERSKLEKEMIAEERFPSADQAIRRISSGSLKPNSAGKVRPINHQVTGSPTSTPNRSVPLKGCHAIASQQFLESTAAKTREINSAKLARPSARSGSSKVQSPNSRSLTRPEKEALAPTHVTIRTAKGPVPRSANLVKVASIPVQQHNGEMDGLGLNHAPCPPSSAKPPSARPSSAARFRNMVLNCRDSS